MRIKTRNRLIVFFVILGFCVIVITTYYARMWVEKKLGYPTAPALAEIDY